MDNFARTQRGAHFFDRDVPKLAKGIDALVEALDRHTAAIKAHTAALNRNTEVVDRLDCNLQLITDIIYDDDGDYDWDDEEDDEEDGYNPCDGHLCDSCDGVDRCVRVIEASLHSAAAHASAIFMSRMLNFHELEVIDAKVAESLPERYARKYKLNYETLRFIGSLEDTNPDLSGAGLYFQPETDRFFVLMADGGMYEVEISGCSKLDLLDESADNDPAIVCKNTATGAFSAWFVLDETARKSPNFFHPAADRMHHGFMNALRLMEDTYADIHGNELPKDCPYDLNPSNLKLFAFDAPIKLNAIFEDTSGDVPGPLYWITRDSVRRVHLAGYVNSKKLCQKMSFEGNDATMPDDMGFSWGFVRLPECEQCADFENCVTPVVNEIK